MVYPREELSGFPLLRGFAPAELDALTPIMELRHLSPGSLIFSENDASHEIYFICSGRVGIFAPAQQEDGDHLLAELSGGEAFGELAFLDGSARSASARALEETELLVLCKQQLERLPGSDRLTSHLASNIALTNAERLKRSNQNYVASLEKQLAAMRLQHHFGHFFIYVLACYAVGTILNTLLHTYLQDVDVYARTFTWSYLLILLLPSVYMVWKLQMPLSFLGVTRRNWRKALSEGLIASGVCVAVCAAFALVSRGTGWVSPVPIASAVPWIPSYMLHSAVQEFLARGIVQTSFQRFFGDERGWRSIFLASILFSLFHVHFGLMAVAITLVTSILFGWLYLRHQNLIGVSLLHWTLGTCAFIFGIL